MSTLTQFLSGKLKSQEFLSSSTFTVPAGVTTVWVTMTGGGGSGSNATGGSGWAAAGGGAGAYVIKQAVNVTPGASITVTIGAGGSGVDNTVNTGNNGGATSFGSVSVSGGEGGPRGSSGIVLFGGGGGARGGGARGTSANSGALALPPESCGGKPGLATDPYTQEGSGAGGLFGDGTNSGAGVSAAANSGAGTGGHYNNTNFTGNGGSGRCIVEWLA